MNTSPAVVQLSLFEAGHSCDDRADDTEALARASSVDKLVRLVDRVLSGGVVPFLGAGVSMECCGPDGRKIAKTAYMTCCVCDQLYKDKTVVCRLLANKTIKRCCRGKGNPFCGKRMSLAEACERYTWDKEMDSLVCNVLYIGKFTELEISRAHRYIAYLAREGLVQEVITTNYDTCIEKAYSESLGVGKEDAAFSIGDLEEYRRYGGKTKTEPNTMIPYLKVYHVNGCAKKLNESKTKDELHQACESIVLTERQLQDWGKRQWAKDLLRDRLRSKNVVFSGFGSPEPQVRHTVLQILEEFELNSGGTEPSADPWIAPNAVYVHAYHDLTFGQQQILRAYVRTHGRNVEISEIRRTGNCFTVEDTIVFPTGKRRELPADVFWEALFKAVFWRLLKSNWLSHESPFYYLLESRVRCADLLLQKTSRWILPPDRSDAEGLYGHFEKLLDFDDAKHPKNLVLSKMVWGIRHRRETLKPGWYASLRDKGIIISAYFLVRYILESLSQRKGWELEERCSTSLGTGFSVRVPVNGRWSTLLVLLAHDESRFHPNEALESDVPDLISITQVIIGNASPCGRCRVKTIDPSTCTGVKRQRIINVLQLGLVDLFTWLRGSSGTEEEVFESMEMAILHPSLVLSEKRPRGKLRTIPVRGA